jgi:DNA repair protein RadC
MEDIMVYEAVYTKKIKKEVNVRNPEDAYRLVKKFIKDSRQEQCFIITTDRALNVIGVHLIHIGSRNTVDFNMRDIFYKAIIDNAYHVIICHNHNGPNINPSPNDIASAQEAYKAGTILHITVFDVMIISEYGYTSIKPSFDLVSRGEIKFQT